MTREQLQDQMIKRALGIAGYWAQESRPGVDRFDGLGHSMGAGISGSAIDVPAWVVAPPCAEWGEHLAGDLIPRLQKLGLASAELIEKARRAIEWPAGQPEFESFEERFLARWQKAALVWGEENLSVSDQLKGCAVSILWSMQGDGEWAGAWCQHRSTPDDAAWSQEQGKRWARPMPEDHPSWDSLDDIGGGLHQRWAREWGRESPRAERIRAWMEAAELESQARRVAAAPKINKL